MRNTVWFEMSVCNVMDVNRKSELLVEIHIDVYADESYRN